MTKKASATAAAAATELRRVLWVWWKLVITLSLALCVLAFLRLQRYSPSDSELAFASANSVSISRRSRAPDGDFRGNPKIAFLFLAKKNLPLDFLWGSFFENADIANFSIYIHSEPGFVFDESTTRSTFFYNRQLKNSVKVAWGESSMIEAERLLFVAALDDPRNQRFVLLSDSCVPLHNFGYIYKYLVNSPRSFVDSFIDKKDGRYNPMMLPYIPKSKWRKGSQWITLIRKHAEVVADDEAIFPVFKKLCKRGPPIEASREKLNLKPQKQNNCISDEHYVQTLLEMLGLVRELERRTVTHTVWNCSEFETEKNWHPVTFYYRDARPENIKRIKGINNVYYETEFRTEWCRNNHTLVPCFLFARKFSRAAAMRLLSDEVVSQFDPSTAMH
ncbi:glycosyltransferase BC10-like [Ipomoea triloba]|uniref:glycosyltransferase BC10-like n=1 Tax=Ipomoea triloba TaxID=35885 RepID=UPI00125DD881|nr:glycosyltransferase BC10-like [Ipomoea triloba]XP_031124876.1 glycosyltransferase BC10-like [Ipomoea triloba]